MRATNWWYTQGYYNQTIVFEDFLAGNEQAQIIFADLESEDDQAVARDLFLAGQTPEPEIAFVAPTDGQYCPQ